MSVPARLPTSALLGPSHTQLRRTRTARTAAYRCFCVSVPARTAPRRTEDFNSGFSSSYDPTQDTGRGPMFNKASYGVPQFYPRDLKKKVDEYVVGQDRAKKTICSVIFNHYQNIRKRTSEEGQDRRTREKSQRQRFVRDRDSYLRDRILYEQEMDLRERELDLRDPDRDPSRQPHPVEGQHQYDPALR